MQENLSSENILNILNSAEISPLQKEKVRDYQNYFVPFLLDETANSQVFTMPNQYNSDSIPVFLSAEFFVFFQENYLAKHGYLDKIAAHQKTLELRKISGTKLFNLLPKSLIPAFFVLPSDTEEIIFNFNLTKVFVECFQEFQSETDLEKLLNLTEPPENFNLWQYFRALFEHSEWLVLISQTTSKKILNGEMSRDNFALDRNNDRRIILFSDQQTFQDFKELTNQTAVKFYTIKIQSNQIFRADLSAYEAIIVNPKPPQAIQISKNKVSQLNDLFVAVHVEQTIARIMEFRLGYGSDYIAAKRFQKYILAIDKSLTAPNLPNFDFPVCLIKDESGNPQIPVFTAEDNFENFRSQMTQTASIAPYFIDGKRLFYILSEKEMPQIVFNINNPNHAVYCESNFAIKVYCA